MSTDSTVKIMDLRNQIREFINQRGWGKYHNAKDLAISIILEASELLENFQWKTEQEVKDSLEDETKLDQIKKELADVIIYCLSLANIIDIDVSKIVTDKINENSKKYPIKKIKNKYTKYTNL